MSWQNQNLVQLALIALKVWPMAEIRGEERGLGGDVASTSR